MVAQAGQTAGVVARMVLAVPERRVAEAARPGRAAAHPDSRLVALAGALVRAA